MRWLVVAPKNVALFHLNSKAESHVGQVGVEVERMRNTFGMNERRLGFEDGEVHWFYQVWLRKAAGGGE